MPEHQFAKPTPIASDAVGSLVGEFMEEKQREQREEKSRRTPSKRHPLVIPLLVLLLAGIAAAPLVAPRPETISPETLEQGARLNLYLASLRVREYVKTHRQLPAALSDVGVDTTGIEYKRNSADAFELATRILGSRLVYLSTQPDSVFLGPNLRIRGIS